MASDLRNLTTANIVAIGLTGFCGAFALYLLRELWQSRGGLAWAVLNLIAGVVLLAVCAVFWRNVLAPHQARAPWQAFVATGFACALALAARLPGLQA